MAAIQASAPAHLPAPQGREAQLHISLCRKHLSQQIRRQKNNRNLDTDGNQFHSLSSYPRVKTNRNSPCRLGFATLGRGVFAVLSLQKHTIIALDKHILIATFCNNATLAPQFLVNTCPRIRTMSGSDLQPRWRMVRHTSNLNKIES